MSGVESLRRSCFEAFDPTSGTLTYGLYDPLPVQKYAGWAKTSGSSVNVAAQNTGQFPFEGLGVGDELTVIRPDGIDVVNIVTFTDGDTIVVSSAVSWANSGQGFPFSFRKFRSGTAVTDGWFNVSDADGVSIELVVSAFSATKITFSIEARVIGQNTTPVVVTTRDFTATGSAVYNFAALDLPYDEMRVGVSITGDTGVNGVSVYAIKKYPR